MGMGFGGSKSCSTEPDADDRVATGRAMKGGKGIAALDAPRAKAETRMAKGFRKFGSRK